MIAAGTPAPVRRLAVACLTPLLRRAARAYVAGSTLDEAERVRADLAKDRLACTLGFFNGDDDAPATVIVEYMRALHRLRGSGDSLSIKPPALRYEAALLRLTADRARNAGVHLHFDAHAIDTVEPTLHALERLCVRHPPEAFGLTLPGRWPRSVEDAHWAVRRGLPVRVVKGQWADPQAPGHDAADGVLATVDVLAGRAVHVAVASHDPILVGRALTRLVLAGTPCELQLLYGLPMDAARHVAERLGVPVRCYVPYGTAHLPYALGRVIEQPHLIRWLLRDLLAGRSRRLPRSLHAQ